VKEREREGSTALVIIGPYFGRSGGFSKVKLLSKINPHFSENNVNFDFFFRSSKITIDLGGFETHQSGFKSKEMTPATLAPRILWLSTKLQLD
jgi:hypothetical protein